MAEKLIAVISVLWEKENPLVGWGFGPSKRSARRAAVRTLSAVNRKLADEDVMYVRVNPGRQYYVWGQSQGSVKTYKPRR